jgi:streptogramin lyase
MNTWRRLFLSFLIAFIIFVSSATLLGGTRLDSFSVSFPSSSPLPNYAMIQHPLPNGSTQPWGITVDSSGRLWFVEEGSNQIGMYDPKTSSFSEYNVTTRASSLEEIAVDSRGNVWFSELTPSQLGELDPSTGVMHEYKLPLGPGSFNCGPIGVTPSPSGNVWVTCEFSNQIDEFFPSNSSFLSFDLPVFYSAPLDIVFDSKGNFWFTATDSNMLGYVTVPELRNGTTAGIQEFAPTNQSELTTITNTQIPTSPLVNTSLATEQIVSSLQTPSELVLSPDGNSLWITEHVVSSFDQYNIETKSLDKYWTSQTYNPEYATTLPNGIAIDAEGHIWIAEHYGNRITEFDPSSGQMVEYPIPCCGSQIAGSLYLALGQNGTVWFSEFFGNAIGELKPTGLSRPVQLLLSNNNEKISSNGELVVPIEVSLNSSNSGGESMSFNVSGISGTGRLENATASFSPPFLQNTHRTSEGVNLTIVTSNLNPGTYYLTVGAKLSTTGVIYSTILKVTVPSNDSRMLLIYAGIVGVVASVVVVGSLISFSRRRIRYRRRRGR